MTMLKDPEIFSPDRYYVGYMVAQMLMVVECLCT